MNIQLLGWILSRKFRYLAYVWTSNVSQGLGAQVVVGGNLTYTFNKYFALGGGIGALPGVRATEGNFPVWLTVDNRLIGDEFFRPSYTMGVWAKGSIVSGLEYQVMLGNNLSQLGVDAGQLDDGLNTWSGALVWMPTTGEFGTLEGFGDFDRHEEWATRIGARYTRSDENFQGQPDTEAFENVQIRLSDGNIIFTPNLFGDGIQGLRRDLPHDLSGCGTQVPWLRAGGRVLLAPGEWLHGSGDGGARRPERPRLPAAGVGDG